MILRNPGFAELDRIPLVTPQELRSRVVSEVAAGGRLVAFFGGEGWSGSEPVVTAIVARDTRAELVVLASPMGASYPSLTPVCPEAHWFERELWEQYGIVPEGHPWLKPIRGGIRDFYQVQGGEIHEVAVGPVHAGVIEPGHFRFQCWGETVYHLEISLGYQHRGVERLLQGGPDRRSAHIAETLAGDTTVGHATAYSGVVESLAGLRVSPRAHAIRALALELERMACHVGDLGALAGDVGYLPTSAYCGRIRGDVLNMSGLLTGSRFGRSLVRPGGVTWDVDGEMTKELGRRLEGAIRDTREACSLLWKTPAVLARFENTGVVDRERAAQIGLVGPAARASGLARDTRCDHPWGWYVGRGRESCVVESGDVFARARVRWLEMEASVEMSRAILSELETQTTDTFVRPSAAPPPLRPRELGCALVEGWRGEICHVAVTGAEGRFTRYKVVDPSFHNWFGLACALRGQQISDFPLCNKSFNLSYCGHDL